MIYEVSQAGIDSNYRDGWHFKLLKMSLSFSMLGQVQLQWVQQILLIHLFVQQLLKNYQLY